MKGFLSIRLAERRGRLKPAEYTKGMSTISMASRITNAVSGSPVLSDRQQPPAICYCEGSEEHPCGPCIEWAEWSDWQERVRSAEVEGRWADMMMEVLGDSDT